MLCDVVMPGDIDGRELGKRVMASHPRMRILLMSGYSEGANPANPGNRGDQGNQGNPPLLAKPFIRQQLAQALQTRPNAGSPSFIKTACGAGYLSMASLIRFIACKGVIAANKNDFLISKKQLCRVRNIQVAALHLRH